MEILESLAESQPISSNSNFSQEELLKLESMEFDLEINNSSCVEKIQVLVPQAVTNNSNTSNVDALLDASLQNEETTSSLSVVKDSTNCVQGNDDVGFVSMIKPIIPNSPVKKKQKLRSCNICHAKFPDKNAVNRHKRKFHQKELKTAKQKKNTQTKTKETVTASSANIPEANPFMAQQEVIENQDINTNIENKPLESFLKTSIPLESVKSEIEIEDCKLVNQPSEHFQEIANLNCVKTESDKSKIDIEEQKPNLYLTKKTNNTNSAEIDKRWYSCNVCSGKLPSEKQVQIHIRSFHPGQNCKAAYVATVSKTKLFGCGRCSAMFSDKNIVKQHKEKFHPKKMAKKEGNTSSTETVEQLYSCEVCSGQFLNKRNLKKHRTKFHPNKNSAVETTKVAPKEYKCHICGLPFKEVSSRRSHFLEYHKDQVLKCETCGLEFCHQANFNRHMRKFTSAHYRCSVCSITIKDENKLKNHIKKWHRNISI